MKKKKLLYQSDFSLAKTGFGRAAKALLSYLYKTGKYDITHYSCGLPYTHPEFERTPWKTVGSLPNNPQEMQELNKDPNIARLASYGAHYLDKVVQEEKPDVYIAVQDIWGIDFAVEKKWFDKITSVLWTTLDSLPILPAALTKANKIKNYWIWSNFATKAMHELGHKHVKTVHGPIDIQNFYRLENSKREELRKRFNLPLDAFIIGFVFRNQLRKSVPNLLEGYALWKRSNPHIKNTYLLLHTHWGEGWNIHRLAQEYGINLNEILTTYICRNCGNYEVKPFHGPEVDCRFCNTQKSQITTNVSLGVTEDQLNEVYNLMDVYCHPFTSGGQEIPIQEAKLTELITLVTNYSCGEEMCEQEAESFELDWSEYREHGTEFKKASTKPSSIAKQLNKVYNMPIQKRREMGRKAREWTVDNFSVEIVGKFIEDFIDNAPESNYDFSTKEEEKNPYFQVPEIKNDSEWIISLYHNILKMKDVDENDEGYKYWMHEISKGAKRIDIENYFRTIATQENQKNKQISFEELLGEGEPEDRILYVMPDSIGDVYLSTSLFKSIKKQYPNKKLYVATNPQNFPVLDGNPHVDKVIRYIPQMDQLMWLEGIGDHKGFFEIAFLPHALTQRILTYVHNGKTNIEMEIKN